MRNDIIQTFKSKSPAIAGLFIVYMIYKAITNEYFRYYYITIYL